MTDRITYFTLWKLIGKACLLVEELLLVSGEHVEDVHPGGAGRLEDVAPHQASLSTVNIALTFLSIYPIYMLLILSLLLFIFLSLSFTCLSATASHTYYLSVLHTS